MTTTTARAATTPAPTLPTDVQARLEEHAFSETAREVGGILIGTLVQGGVEITASIPALRAAGAATHVTFTHEVWADVLDTVESDHPGQQIVGWYHTHPGFGLFLSEYDLFIHRNFFTDERMVALVVDPLAGELGWFGWESGDVVKTATQPTATTAVQRKSDVRAAESRTRSRRRSRSLAVAGVVLVSGIAGYAASSVINDPAEEIAAYQPTIADQEALISALEADADPAPETPTPAPTPKQSDVVTDPEDGTATVLYEVQAGDSWWSIAETFLGDGSRYGELVAANDGVELHPGATVLVPSVPVAD